MVDLYFRIKSSLDRAKLVELTAIYKPNSYAALI